MRTLIALVLLCITFTLAWKLPPKSTIFRPPRPTFTEADAEWIVPALTFAGRAVAGGALSAAGSHLYNKVFRRDGAESDFQVCFKGICYKSDEIESEFLPALAPAAIFAGKALAAGALGAAGKHAYDRIFRRDDTESEFPIIPVAVGAYKAYKVAKNAKAIYGEGKNIYNSVKNIRNIIRSDNVESEFPIIPVALGAWKLYNALKKKDSVEADAEFLGKIVGKVKGVVSKGMNIYNKAKPFIGIAKNFIDSEESDFSIRGAVSKAKEWYPKAKAVYGEGKNIYKSVQNIRGILKKDGVESDAEFLKNVVSKAKEWYPKGKAIYGEGKNIYKSVQNIRGILKNKDDAEFEADVEFLGKFVNKVKGVVGKVKGIVEKGKAVYANGKNIFDSAKNIAGLFKKNKQDSESDFLGALKLGFKAFKAIKGLKKNKKPKQQQAQPEADMLKDIVAKLKDKIKAKLAKLQEKKAAKKAEKKPVEEKEAKRQEKKAAKKASKKAEKKPVEESDAEFIEKLKNWWNNKGKDLFAKGKKIYEAYKQAKSQQ